MGLIDRFRRQAPELAQPPRADGKPRSTAGRGHTAGFIDQEEFVPDLRHPQCHDVYDEMYDSDGDVKQVMSMTLNPVLGGTWEVAPYGGEEATDEDIKVADWVRWALFEQMSPNLIGHLAEFGPVLLRSGFADGEKLWMGVDYEGQRKLALRSILLRLPRTITQFEQDAFGELTRIKQYLPSPMSSVTQREGGSPNTGLDGDTPGEVWLPRKDIVHYRVGIEGDNWQGKSLLRSAHKHWYLKDKIEKIDAIAQEREALGIPIAYPPMGATEPQLDAIESILASVRANEEGYIVAPGPKAGSGMAPEGQGWLFEILGYDRTGSGRDPQPSLEYHSLKIAAAFMAEFMRLGHGTTGARATAQVQADPFLMAIEALTSTIIEPQIKWGMVLPLVAYNFPNVKNLPTVKMSLVDSTSLQQLADFVQKLVQVGVLLPDQELENFLRARADLPAPNPKSVKKRGEKDDDIRREVVQGPPAMGEGHDQPGKPHGTKPAAGQSKGGSRGGPNRNSATERDEISDEAVTLESYLGGRHYSRDPKWYELIVDLAGIEDHLDAAPFMFEQECREHVSKMAKSFASEPMGECDDEHRAPMRERMMSLVQESYDYGRQTVADEAHAQLLADVARLDRGARDRGGALEPRSKLAAEAVEHAMRHATLSADLIHGQRAGVQATAEKAGAAALRRVGKVHGAAAFFHGRHDEAHALAEADNEYQFLGARYTSIIDHNRCSECESADDGVVRDFDDPVRLDRMPPNHHCHSTASGDNMCRCFEVYELMPPDTTLATLDDEGMPEFVTAVASALIDRGANPSRAVAVAKQIARAYCRTGRMPWPGLSDLGLTRAAACDAAGWQ